MGELLDAVIIAHGGLDRWNAVRSVDVTFNFSGALFDLKGFPGHHHPTASVDAQQPRVVMQRLDGEADDRWIFGEDRVWIERGDGWIEEERLNPRATFAGHDRYSPWDRLHLTYFIGYAIWNYLTVPFLLARSEFDVRELGSHVEGRETWRVLEVTYPDNIPAHTKTQQFHSDSVFILKRLDYVADVLGGVAAHYCYDPVTVDGLIFPTLRTRRASDPRGVALDVPYLVPARLHEPGDPDVRWTINNRSAPVTTAVGAVAVRIDDDPEGSPPAQQLPYRRSGLRPIWPL